MKTRWAQRLLKSRSFPYLGGLLSFLIFFSAFVVTYQSIEEWVRRRDRGPVQTKLGQMRKQLEITLNSALLLPRSLEAFVASDPKVEDAAFQSFAKRLMDFYPGILSLRLSHGSIVEHVAPPERARLELRTDLTANPELKQAIARLNQPGQLMVVGPSSTTEAYWQLTGIAPIFRPAAANRPALPELWGYAIVEFSLDGVLRGFQETANNMGVRFCLTSKGRTLAGDESIGRDNPTQDWVMLPGGEAWPITAIPAGGWTRPVALAFVAAGGFVISAIISLIVFWICRTPSRLQEAVERATAESRASEERFRNLFEAGMEGVIVHEKGIVVDANQAFERLSGYSLAELRGMDLLRFMAEELRENIRLRIMTGVEGQFESTIVHKEGQRVEVEVFVKQHEYLGRTVRIVALHDITERLRARQALQYRLEFEQLIASLSSHFINLAPEEVEGGVDFALKRLGEFARVDRCYIFRFSSDEVTMSNTHEWHASGIPAEAHNLQDLRLDAYPWFIEKLRKLETIHIPKVDDLPAEAAAEKKIFQDQGIRSLINVPLVYAGKPVGFLGFDAVREERIWSESNISLLNIAGEMLLNALERQRADQALREAYANLDFANRQLQEYSSNLEEKVLERTTELEAQKERALEASRLKSEFLSVISHELRTPLNSILGLAQVVIMKVGDTLPPQQRNNLRNIVSSGNRLLSLINQLLTLSKAEAGKMEVAVSEFTVDSVVAEAADGVRPLAERKGLKLRVRNLLAGERVLSDRHKLVQILVNLLGNAVKFTDRGHVDLAALESGDGVLFEVSDTGIGIGPEEQQIIFEAFRQADSSDTRRHGGTGLGLTISLQFARLIGGRLSVESEKGKGATFRLWTPKVFAPQEKRSESWLASSSGRTI